MADAGETAFKLAFVISPIVFVGGIAQNIPGGILPLGLVSGALSFAGGLLSGGVIDSLDDIYPQFQPIPGGTLAEYDLGRYPFANQAVAANATIAQPLVIAMKMFWPAQPRIGGYGSKLLGMMALQSAITQHGSNGGTYTVLTPSYFYTNLILKRLSDITSGQSKQPQSEWQWEFEQPLLTLEAAQNVQNSLMSKLTGGGQIDDQPAWSSPSNITGTANSAQSPAIVPLAGGGAGGITSPFTTQPSGLPTGAQK